MNDKTPQQMTTIELSAELSRVESERERIRHAIGLAQKDLAGLEAERTAARERFKVLASELKLRLDAALATA